MNKNKVTRQPRPKGYTFALQHYHSTQNKEILQKLKQLTIQEWAMNSYRINGQILTINQLAHYIGESIAGTMLGVNKALVRFANLFDNDKDKGQWARAQLSGAIFRIAETEALVAQQVDVLMASQGAEYKPFISGEVNRALANLIAAQKPKIELLKMVQDKNTVPIMPMGNPQSTTETTYISKAEALALISQSSPSMLDDVGQIRRFLGSEEDYPNVDARYQDLTKIGIKTLATDIAQKESEKAARNKADKDAHREVAKKGQHRELPLEVEDDEDFRL